MLKDVLGLKAEQLSSDDLCAYALDQMDTLQKKYQKYSGTSEHWKFGYDLLLAAVEEVDRFVVRPQEKMA